MMKIINRRRNRLSNGEGRFNDIGKEIEASKDRFYFMLHGLNGFNR